MSGPSRPTALTRNSDFKIIEELWATGENAWGQLDFSFPVSTYPDDLGRFTLVLQSSRLQVEGLYKFGTRVRTAEGIRYAGNTESFTDLENFSQLQGVDLSFNTPTPIAFTGINRAAFAVPGCIKEFNVSPDGSIPLDATTKCLKFQGFDSPVVRVVATMNTFTALTSAGRVYTWGEGARPTARLGREVSDASPARTPCEVLDLSNLPDPVMHISSGGGLTAALTSGRDIYIWGGGVAAGPLQTLWSPTPQPLDLDGYDFLDVAVGNNHILVLTTERKIFAIGANRNGQLGLAPYVEHREWTQVPLLVDPKHLVTRVYAGHSNSLLAVQTLVWI